MRSFAVVVISGLISLGVFSQTPKPKTSPSKASNPPVAERSVPGVSQAGEPGVAHEKGQLERIGAIGNNVDKAVAAKEFLAAFPDSKFKGQAQEILVKAETEEGYSRLQSGDLESAVARFLAASTAASKPIDSKLFKDVLSRLPANLYFRGARVEGLRIAGILEEKTEGNAEQTLNLANFYLSVENGSKARQLAESAIKIRPEWAEAYQTLGLANRMDFQFEESAAAYEKALAHDPESNLARRGLAEMKRSLGKADEALILFREIFVKDLADLPARTGLVLSTFETGKRSEAEAEMAKFLEVNPGNVILLAGAAYWYASQGEGEKAVEFAQKAIDSDPRYIWSHIALARGYMALKKPLEAERTLLAARRYGNFPTLEYEIASSRLVAGFFRDASEELAKSFTVSDGLVKTNLGGRISRTSRSFSELIGFERRASIFTPVDSDASQNDSKLTALLELTQAAALPKPDTERILRAIDKFIEGDDAMKLHRRLFAAGLLLDKKIEPQRAADIAQAAIGNVDAGLDAPHANAAVLASELYENRTIAVARGEYINVPEVPRATLSAIVRGRIEEINGWAKFQMGDAEAAVVRLKRAVSVLPGNSAWWQSASWRLGVAFSLNGKDAEALETFIRTYKASQPDRFRYDTIAALYRKVHGNTEDLESLIGPDPALAFDATIGTKSKTAGDVGTKAGKDGELTENPEARPLSAPIVAGSAEPAATPVPTPEIPTKGQPPPVSTPIREPVKDPDIEKQGSTAADPPLPQGVTNAKAVGNSDLFPPVVITIPPSDAKKLVLNKSIPFLPNPVPLSARSGNEKRSDDHSLDSAHTSTTKEQTDRSQEEVGSAVGNRAGSEAPVIISQCILTASDETLTLQSGSGGKAIIVGIDDETDLNDMKGYSSSPENVKVLREPISGINSKALYVIRSETGRAGVYQVTFELPCGKKVIVVKVH